MNEYPTITSLSQETGLTKAAIGTVVQTHRIPFDRVGAAMVITTEGMKQLRPILNEMVARHKPRGKYKARKKKATASA